MIAYTSPYKVYILLIMFLSIVDRWWHCSQSDKFISLIKNTSPENKKQKREKMIIDGTYIHTHTFLLIQVYIMTDSVQYCCYVRRCHDSDKNFMFKKKELDLLQPLSYYIWLVHWFHPVTVKIMSSPHIGC